MSVFDVPVFLGLTRQMEPGGGVSELRAPRQPARKGAAWRRLVVSGS